MDLIFMSKVFYVQDERFYILENNN